MKSKPRRLLVCCYCRQPVDDEVEYTTGYAAHRVCHEAELRRLAEHKANTEK